MSQQENLFSSPAPARREKERRPPTVTPKRFNRFFNPTLSRCSSVKTKSQRALHSLSASTTNSRPFRIQYEIEDDSPFLRPSKRRKQATPECDEDEEEQGTFTDVSFQSSPLKPSPFRSLRTRRQPAKSLFPSSIRKASRYDQLSCLFPDVWQSHTADFYSSPNDLNVFDNLPYCTTSFNNESLIAVGDEAGNLNLIDTASDKDFKIPLITLKPHNNAIMDLTLSYNDKRLVTVAGDKIARVIDVQTQIISQTLWAGSLATPKQVTFQPESEHVLTTCGRDGTVQIWDLRLPARTTPVIQHAPRGYLDMKGDVLEPHKTFDIGSAEVAPSTRSSKRDILSTNTVPQSVTSIRFFPNRPHLFITSNAMNSRIRVWDIRSRLRSRSPSTSSASIPVSTSVAVRGIGATRDHGVSDTVFSPCGSRFYSVCRDGSIHVYSASHLVLGQTPSISSRPKQNQTGSLPIYRFVNPKMLVDTFYVRAAIRRPTDHHCGLLATGNSMEGPMLFPTDERIIDRLLKKEGSAHRKGAVDYDYRAIPTLNVGTKLIRGHSSEVTSVSWSQDGELVSVCDDRSIRIWREDAEKARKLRECGEIGGERWNNGWADVDKSWDEEEEG